MPITSIKYRGKPVTPPSGEDINLDSPVSIMYGGVEKGTINAGTKKTLKTNGKISLYNIYLNEFGLKTAGKEFDSDIEIEVANYQVLSIPAVSGSSSITYNKNSQHPIVNYDSNKITATGDLNATVVGSYRITYSINDKLTYTWTDGTQEDKYIDWSIVKEKVPIPTLSGSYTYNKQSQSVKISGYNSEWMTQTGDINGIEAKDYYITWKLLDTVNTEWSDNTITDKVKSWSIIKKEISIPTISGSFTYDKATHNPSISGYDSDWMTQTGVISESQSGEHTVTWDLSDKDNSCWTGGTTSAKNGSWSIAVRKLTIPTVSGTYTYNGGSQEAQISEFDSNYETKTGDLTGTNAGDYRITFSLPDKTNTAWSDNSTTNKYGDWSIDKLSLAIPSVSGSYTYNGSEQTVTKTNFNTTYEDVTGDKETNAGSHTAVFTLKVTANTQWTDGTIEPQSKTWSIAQKTITTPSQKNVPTYSGSAITPEWNNYDSSIMSVSVNPQTNAGTYSATFTITDNNYKFSNGSTVTVNWSISKKDPILSVSPTSYTCEDTATVYNGTITYDGDGTLTATNKNTTTLGAATLSTTISGKTLNVQATKQGNSNNNFTITISASNGTNYNAASITASAVVNKAGSSCVSGDTLILMGDGTEKPISEIKRGDSVMTYNMDTGKFEPQIVSIFWDESNVVSSKSLHLTFDDGNVIKVIYSHGFFDKTLNTYVYFNYANYHDYIGHEFIAYGEDGYRLVKLVNAEIVEGEVSQYSLETAYNDNFITEGLISMTQEPCEGRFEYFKFDENEVKWDAKDKQENIDKYGLYTWEEWKDLIPDEEMFYAWNGPYFKILMEKGIVTMDDIYYMLEDASHGIN